MSAFNQIIQFAVTGHYQPVDLLFRAQTRSEVSDRLLGWAKILQQNSFPEEASFLIASVVGEIANNSFDHNLGKWKDQTGCLISFDFSPDRLRIGVVDRGQGIVKSLQAIRPNLKKSSDYLVMAFEEIVSGRAPEQRGNGLKYVRKNFLENHGFELVCLSSGNKYRLGNENNLEALLKPISNFEGTLVALDWNRQKIK